MSLEEKIEFIEKCLRNKYFYNCKDELYDYSEYILKYVDFILSYFEEHQMDLTHVDEEKRLSYSEIIFIVEDYFKSKNIDVTSLFNDGTISFEPSKEKQQDGTSFERDGRKLIDIFSLDSLVTPGVLIHEIYHFLNQSQDNSLTRELLTEAVSYSEGLIYYDKRSKDNPNLLLNEIKSMIRGIFHCGNELFTIYTFIDVYRKNGNIKREYFTCDDERFNFRVDSMFSLLNENINIFRTIWNFIGFSLGLYLYARYKDEPKFEEKIDYVSQNLQRFDINTCLNYWGITSFDNLIPKIEKYYNQLFKITNEKEKVQIVY